MGTNYFARIIPSLKDKEYIKSLIDKDKFFDLEDCIKDKYIDSEVHLGKRSSGWKFLFNPNYERYYKLTKEGLREFLGREDIIIYSGYFRGNNRRFRYVKDPDKINSKCEYLWTPDQFLNMAFNWCPNGFDHKKYEEIERKTTPGYYGYNEYSDYSNEKYWREKGYSPQYYEFYNDGLRWSTCCKFS